MWSGFAAAGIASPGPMTRPSAKMFKFGWLVWTMTLPSFSGLLGLAPIGGSPAKSVVGVAPWVGLGVGRLAGMDGLRIASRPAKAVTKMTTAAIVAIAPFVRSRRRALRTAVGVFGAV